MKHQMRRCFCETKRDKGWSKATVGSDKLHLHDADADADAVRMRQPPLLSPDLGPPPCTAHPPPLHGPSSAPTHAAPAALARCKAVYGAPAAPWQQRACVRACDPRA